MVFSHTHGDHVGNGNLFSNATVHIQTFNQGELRCDIG